MNNKESDIDLFESEDIPAKAAPTSASTKGDVGLPMNKMIIAVVAIILVVVATIAILTHVSEKLDEPPVETTAYMTGESEPVVMPETTPADIIGIWSFGDGNNILYMSFNEDGTLDVWTVDSDGQELNRTTNTYTLEGNALGVYQPDGSEDYYICIINGDSLTLEDPAGFGESYVLTRTESLDIPVYTAADLVGTWVSDSSNSYIWMTFNEDGTLDVWVIDANGVEIDRTQDTYTIEGNQLTISYPTDREEDVYNISINGDMLILAYPDQPDQLFGYIRQH